MSPTDCEVAVIGAGIVGSSVAYELARRGTDVLVVAPESAWATSANPQGTASAAAGAMLSLFSEIEPHQSAERVTEDTSERLIAHGIWQRWLAALSEDGLFVGVSNGTWVVGRSDESSALDTIASTARRHGHVAEEHEANEVPGLSGQRCVVSTALWLPSESSVDSAELLMALHSSLRQHPLVTCVEDSVIMLLADKGRKMIQCTGETIRARRVVLAAGAGTAPLLSTCGSELGVPVLIGGHGSGLLVRASAPPRYTVRTVNRAFSCGTHLVPRSHGLTYLGSSNRYRRVAASGSAVRATLDEIVVLTNAVTSELDEGMFEAELVSAHAGVRPYTLDHRPLVGPTGDSDILLATGTYRSGFVLAPRMAELVADEMEKPGTHQDHPYAVGRNFPEVDTDTLLEIGGSGLVDALCEPGGQLPPGVKARLATFIIESLRMALVGQAQGETAEALRRLWAETPVAEAIPALLRLTQDLKDGQE